MLNRLHAMKQLLPFMSVELPTYHAPLLRVKTMYEYLAWPLGQHQAQQFFT
ncbi:hypothetical protein SDRG_03593 [Saprolegnia diclina VS20]|uniref:Uncharacterized protein n=1 Tax=Saprolegnia diclina (strain VS20) TaxID=1156394 RepID=T0QXI8_SAPDV|nr:hypothetical protein SDRG_03593 [Saprolegnia diclina VS20]EQC39391.1 hypothetical protein SDRG_03593 [Saprolegnia diclina VS20]|eukprot:XP_008607452.1 hypothetical protein SDRG_03593 [Saprolegnia diclina VS20]